MQSMSVRRRRGGGSGDRDGLPKELECVLGGTAVFLVRSIF